MYWDVFVLSFRVFVSWEGRVSCDDIGDIGDIVPDIGDIGDNGDNGDIGSAKIGKVR